MSKVLKQAAIVVAAVCSAWVLLPLGVQAATSAVRIVDGGGDTAAVSSNNALKTFEVDAGNGNKGKITSDGKRLVGDGSGALTVDGAVGARTLGPSRPFSVTSTSGGLNHHLLGSGKVALTDVVMTHDNADNSRLNVIIGLYQDGGNGDCTTAGAFIKHVFPNMYIPAEDVTTVNFTTPIVATGSPVCLRVTTGSNAGLFFAITVSGYIT